MKATTCEQHVLCLLEYADRLDAEAAKDEARA